MNLDHNIMTKIYLVIWLFIYFDQNKMTGMSKKALISCMQKSFYHFHKKEKIL